MKYMGSKARLAKELLPIILKERKENQWYVEPFVGGANMIERVKGNRIGNDSNEYLIALLSALSNEYVPPMITREEYKAIQKNKSDYPKELVGWAGIGCSYCGKWFGGFAGEVKTAAGTTRNYQAEAQKNAIAQSLSLHGVVFNSVSYLDLFLPEDAIIYCDPPYAETTKYKDVFDHERFWKWCDEVAKKHKIFVSEYTAPPNWECVWSKQVGSSLGANGVITGRKQSVECLFIPSPM